MKVRTLGRYVLIPVLLGLTAFPAAASDHADPIDIANRVPGEASLSDLFVFPDNDFTQLVVILCVRPALTGKEALELEPYTYEVYMDLHSRVDYSDEQSRLRYGGRVADPRGIFEDVILSFRLDNEAALIGTPAIYGLGDVRDRIEVWGGPIEAAKPRTRETWDRAPLPDRINIWSGIADDPFIFPEFFGTNVVAIVTTLPMELFPNQQDWIIWGSAIRDGERVDHVGRASRTQNPRFELLNTLHPRDHIRAIREEHEHPSLIRDVFLRLGITSLFGYRTWDQVPDVMLYTRRPIVFVEGGAPSDGNARFPNGRRLEDDVAEALARYGDTLLKENSYIAGGWPRATQNDLPLRTAFPYLADPWPGGSPRLPVALTAASKVKLGGIAVVALSFWVLTAFLLAKHIPRRRRSVAEMQERNRRSPRTAAVAEDPVSRGCLAPPPAAKSRMHP